VRSTILLSTNPWIADLRFEVLTSVDYQMAHGFESIFKDVSRSSRPEGRSSDLRTEALGRRLACSEDRITLPNATNSSFFCYDLLPFYRYGSRHSFLSFGGLLRRKKINNYRRRFGRALRESFVASSLRTARGPCRPCVLVDAWSRFLYILHC
jgi:hypothetical protein